MLVVVAILLLLVLTVLLRILVLVVVSLTTSPVSSLTSLSTSTSIVVSLTLIVVLSLLAITHHLVSLVSSCILIHLLLHSTEILLSVLSPAEVDDLIDIIDIHISLLFLQVLLGLPEVNLHWLGSKHSRLVIKSDALLSSFYIAVKHVTNLVVYE